MLVHPSVCVHVHVYLCEGVDGWMGDLLVHCKTACTMFLKFFHIFIYIFLDLSAPVSLRE